MDRETNILDTLQRELDALRRDAYIHAMTCTPILDADARDARAAIERLQRAA